MTLPLLAGADYFPSPDRAGGWRSVVGKDAAQVRKVAGMDLPKLDQAFEYAQRTSQHGGLAGGAAWLAGVREVLRQGQSGSASRPWRRSAKRITSIACGIMLRRQHDKIPDGLEQKVFNEKYLPEALPLSDPAQGGHQAGPTAVDGGRVPWRRRQSGLRRLRAVGEADARCPGPSSRWVRIMSALQTPLGPSPAAAIRTRRRRRM